MSFETRLHRQVVLWENIRGNRVPSSDEDSTNLSEVDSIINQIELDETEEISRVLFRLRYVIDAIGSFRGTDQILQLKKSTCISV